MWRDEGEKGMRGQNVNCPIQLYILWHLVWCGEINREIQSVGLSMDYSLFAKTRKQALGQFGFLHSLSLILNQSIGQLEESEMDV